MTKNKAVNKLICGAIILLLLAGTVAGVWLGLVGRDTQMVTVRENGEWVDKALYRQIAFIPNTLDHTWQEAFKPSVALGGGFSYTFSVQKLDGVSDADFAKQVKQTADTLKKRAEMMTGSVETKISGDQITLTVAGSGYDSALAELLTTTGNITFCLYDEAAGAYTAPFLTSENITSAGYYINNGTYYLSILFDKAGAKAFADTTAANIGNYIYILMDGNAVAYPQITEAITDNGTSISMESQEQALNYAVLMRSGPLAAAVAAGDTGAAAATLGGFMDIAVLVMAVIVLLSMAWFILRGRFMGVLGAWALLAEIVLFFLFATVTALSGGMVLTIVGMIVLMLCVLSAIFGMEVVLGRTGAGLKKGRGIRAAAGDAFGKSFKLLGIVYGAMLALGLLLMFIFQSATFGLLGRMIAISAIGNMLMIYLFLRLVLSCNFVLLGDNAKLYGAK